MALPNASIWRSPPDRSPASRDRSGASAGKNWNTSASRWRRSAALARFEVATVRFSATVRLGKTLSRSGTSTMPRAVLACGGWFSIALAGETDAAGGDAGVVEADEAGDGAQRRGLAGAVVAEQRDDGLRHHAQRDAVQRHRDAVVGDLEAVDGEKRRGRGDGVMARAPSRREANAFLMRRQMPIRPAGSSSRNRIMTTPKAA